MNDWFGTSFKDLQNEHIKKDIDLNFDDSEFEKTDNKKNTNEYNNLKETKKIKTTVNDIRVIEKLRKEELNKVIDCLPKKNEYIHIVSNGNFDYFKLIPRILQLSKNNFNLYASTWTMNYSNIDELTKLIEVGKINNCTILVGDYLRKREPLVFQHLKQSLYENNGKLIEFSNHAKIICMSDKENYYVIEMSANFTANRRTEQMVFCNSKLVYDFHVKWMEELINDK